MELIAVGLAFCGLLIGLDILCGKLFEDLDKDK